MSYIMIFSHEILDLSCFVNFAASEGTYKKNHSELISDSIPLTLT